MSRVRTLIAVSCALLISSIFGIQQAAAQGPVFTSGNLALILVDNNTRVGISNMGTAPLVRCHSEDRQICDECFAVCVDQEFEVGACGEVGVNLLPSLTGPSFLRPFFYPTAISAPVFLTPIPQTSPPEFDISVVPAGKLIYVMTDNAPTGGKCIGVRTTFTFDRSTCTLCKLRKFYNTCTTTVRITQLHEWDRPCDDATFSSSGLIASAVTEHALITLGPSGSTGANPPGAPLPYQPSVAGSVGLCAFDFTTGGLIGPCDFFNCSAGSIVTGPTSLSTFMEVFLSFFPGGVKLAPVGKPGSEKFVKFCLQVQNLGEED